MREILFRGKRADNGEWAYGYTFDDDSIFQKRFFVGALVVTDARGTTDDVFDVGINFSEVDPATIGQYTGLTGKNGVKIFDGDIVRVCLNPEICVGAVEFDERIGAFIVKFPENKCISFLDLYVARNKAPGLIWAEVIGNIQDSPELLEEES